ncbi:hypothetical protein BAUCODRAFT_187941 [Baudoinia panamericana UAMH 10762]|uniref:Cytochrome P450 alkane hydroxylase n=1 Tax=Baudoinia panamericana (strain UAMH 10762) TaxID=717646 RepID=M2MV99_BAUPA|nr:uncharacterized protein BAUCODRAFT_187941 [Baudoinia panamericana UAMH 10762]EMD00887.1 hypothetical protein BAUCODRAFT_187941 [Baudoinia panamericana UAMH 10762]
MDFSQLPHVVKASILLLAAYVLYQIYVQLTLGRQRRALQYEKGTLPVPWYSGCRDRLLGLDFFRSTMKLLRERRLLEGQTERFHEDGVNTMRVVFLGGTQVFSTLEPENLKAIQAVDFKKWGLGDRRKNAFWPLLGVGIFTSDGKDWHHSREMLRPNFARAQVADLDLFERHVLHLIQAIPKDKSTVDLSDLFFKLTIDSATEFLFGESTESLTKNSGDGFADAFTRSQEHISDATRYGPYAKYLMKNDQFSKDAKFVHDFVDYYVQKGLTKRSQLLAEKGDAEKQRYTFMDELVRQTDNPIRIRSELLNVLLAGRDTTASLLTNVWFVIARRPDIWAKLQAEVDTLNGVQPTYEQVKDMKYLRAVLNESLRLHPVVPLNSRQAQEDTTLPVGGGPDGAAPFFVKKGQFVAWNVYGMHRRKDYYGEDAEEFKPERWLDDAETGKKGLRPGWEYLPFNGGARICLGQQFALTEATYTTVRLCQAFEELESRDDRPWTEMITLTCVNLHGAKVALTPRAI